MVTNVEFMSNDNLLRGRFYTSADSPDREPLIVMTTGDGKSGTKSKTYDAIIPRFLDAGFAVFIFDFAGKGYSEGDDATLTIERATQDLSAAMQVVAKESWVDQDRIGLFGSSFGGQIAVNFVGGHENAVKVMALKSPACFYAEVYEIWIGWDAIKQWKATNYDEEIGRYWESYAEAIEHNIFNLAKRIMIPVLITHGSADTDVPIAQSYRLQACLGGMTDLVVLDGVGHGYEENDALNNAAQQYASWFKRWL